MTTEEKLRALRAEMAKDNLDAYYITGTDPHQSEYVASRWRTREFITGFTGSAGEVIITEKEALLWVDSRYFIQAAKEIKGTEFKMMKIDTPSFPSLTEWLEKNIKKDGRVGVDGSSISISDFLKMEKSLKAKEIKLVSTEDILDRVWKDRPDYPFSKMVKMSDDYAGYTSSAKIDFVRYKLDELKADWTFIASIDDIAWLTNLRGDDIAYNPVFMSYAFVSMNKAVLFTNVERFSSELFEKVNKVFDIHGYEDVFTMIGKLTSSGIGYYSPEKVSYAFAPYLVNDKNIQGRDITTDLKARKNPSELDGMRRAHFQDGVAFVNFMAALDPLGTYNELEIADRFEKEREKTEGYLGPSFAPISGFRENGAQCHYRATEESYKNIDGQGLLVLDTGSQFEYGMTDLTRTLLFGVDATEEEMTDYTLVLKGHLALSRQIFPKGTRGVQLDAIARMFLWNYGETFYHGTGHGVGCRLNVHEGPMRISQALIDVPLEPGMVISNEPGVYKEGKHGIRIENLVAVQKAFTNEFGEFYSFETLSMIPYEKKLIKLDLLTDEEIEDINSYHRWVRENLIDYVREDSKRWLEEATSPIVR